MEGTKEEVLEKIVAEMRVVSLNLRRLQLAALQHSLEDWMKKLSDVKEELKNKDQIKKLADFIMENVKGEPSKKPKGKLT